MIPPFVSQIIGIIVRWGVVWIAGYLAAHAGIKFTQDQIGQAVAYLTPGVAMLVWALYRAYRGRLKLLVAQSAPHVLSEREVEARVNDPQTRNPSLLTKKDEVPQ